MIVKFCRLIIVILLFSCSEDAQPPNLVYEKLDLSEVNKVLVLGNSITIHAPAPDLGWNRNWGMAASSQQKDYVHLLKEELKHINNRLQLEFYSSFGFERNFWEFDLELVTALRGFEADLIIVNLGENVSEADALNHSYGERLGDLIQFLNKSGSAEIVCVNSFWNKDVVNSQILELCISNEYRYVHISDLGEQSQYKALTEFANPAVASHPSDLGMEQICTRILEVLGVEN